MRLICAQLEWLHAPIIIPFPTNRCPWRLLSQVNIATMILGQDDVQQQFICRGLR